MPAWYDIPSLENIHLQEDAEGMKATVSKITSWIKNETAEHGIPSERIVVGGFSQGCAMSLLTLAMSKPKEEGGIGKLAGFFGVSLGLRLREGRIPDSVPEAWAWKGDLGYKSREIWDALQDHNS